MKNIWKKALALMLTIALCVGVVDVRAFAEMNADTKTFKSCLH